MRFTSPDCSAPLSGSRLTYITAASAARGDHDGMDPEPGAFDTATVDGPIAPLLVIGIGDPDRGDAAIGPLVAQRVGALGLPGVDVITDVDLESGHVLDILGRRHLVFVEASSDATEPFDLVALAARADERAHVQTISPAALLDLCAHLGAAVPRSQRLVVRGYAFQRRAPLSAQAVQNVDAAAAMLTAHARVLTSAD